MYTQIASKPETDGRDCNSAIFDDGVANSFVWFIMRSISALSA